MHWRRNMTGQALRFTQLSLALLCVSALGACKKADNAVDTAAARTDSASGRVDSATSANANTMASDSANRANANSNAGTWTNDHIFGYTHNADNGEIALGKLASTKATNAKVKAFGAEMVKDHQAMMKEAHSLMQKVHANVDSTWNDAKDLAGNGADKLKELTDKEKGADWDKNYIESQLDKLQDAAKNGSDTTVTAALSKATAKVQEHLTKAQSIKAGLDNK
jgi:putative membrane protein